MTRLTDGSLFRRLLFLLAALPAVYLFFAIQRGAITVPYWDNCALINLIVPWYDGDFHISSLLGTQNETHPLVYWLVMGTNAILTDWDVRSEFTYIYASFFGIFLLHAWGLRTLTNNGPQKNFVFPTALLVASLIVFSPVSHADHWASVMFILDGANLLIVLGLLIVFLHPQSLAAHLGAAAICWVAAYTFSSGLFAMLSVILAFQLTSERLLWPNRWAAFWTVNLAVLLICYLPGILIYAPGGLYGPLKPSLLQMAEFFFAYLGLPFRGLLWFPYQGMFDQPAAILLNALCGVGLVAVSAFLCWDSRAKLRARDPSALILVGFTMFALISAIVTAWGRADLPPATVSNANASRYTISSAYLMLGQLYYLAAGLSGGRYRDKIPTLAIMLAAITFVALSAVSYGRAIKVYENAFQFNQMVASDYSSWGTAPVPSDKLIFPDPDYVRTLRASLQRLELGPYSNRPMDSIALIVGSYNSFVLLSDGVAISQSFTASRSGLKDISVTLAKLNLDRTAGIVHWQLFAIGNSQLVASGNLNAANIQDWESVRLKLPYLADSEGREYRISFSSGADDSHALAMPLYTDAAGSKLLVTVTNSIGPSKTETLSMNLVLHYAY